MNLTQTSYRYFIKQPRLPWLDNRDGKDAPSQHQENCKHSSRELGVWRPRCSNNGSFQGSISPQGLCQEPSLSCMAAALLCGAEYLLPWDVFAFVVWMLSKRRQWLFFSPLFLWILGKFFEGNIRTLESNFKETTKQNLIKWDEPSLKSLDI